MKDQRRFGRAKFTKTELCAAIFLCIPILKKFWGCSCHQGCKGIVPALKAGVYWDSAHLEAYYLRKVPLPIIIVIGNAISSASRILPVRCKLANLNLFLEYIHHRQASLINELAWFFRGRDEEAIFGTGHANLDRTCYQQQRHIERVTIGDKSDNSALTLFETVTLVKMGNFLPIFCFSSEVVAH